MGSRGEGTRSSVATSLRNAVFDTLTWVIADSFGFPKVRDRLRMRALVSDVKATIKFPD